MHPVESTASSPFAETELLTEERIAISAPSTATRQMLPAESTAKLNAAETASLISKKGRNATTVPTDWEVVVTCVVASVATETSMLVKNVTSARRTATQSQTAAERAASSPAAVMGSSIQERSATPGLKTQIQQLTRAAPTAASLSVVTMSSTLKMGSNVTEVQLIPTPLSTAVPATASSINSDRAAFWERQSSI